ncbi:granzyme A-like [Anomaloglossus baeobatrachus]|uniref:granzyme A-like n=1 Tax=Anomaloglossus baeobatrachus TaxID=238106 RepID=UPI003F4F5F5B
MEHFIILLLSAVCLLVSEGKTVKIINGNEAIPHSRPYMALIYFETETDEMICGGSLIHPNWVLTAGHCHKWGSETSIRLGAHSFEGKEKGAQVFGIFRTIAHPKYNRGTLKNDIRLMKLKGTAKLGKTVAVLPLPKTFEDTAAQTVCETAGWGWTERQDNADFLREVNITVLDREACQKHWKKKVDITDNLICTIVGPKGQDTCTGDSGGPLICKGSFRGVTSFGESVCGKPNDSSIFTRLTKEYVHWINSTISKYS